MLLPTSGNYSSLLFVEFGLTAIAVASAFAWPKIGMTLFRRIEKLFIPLARSKRLAVASAGAGMILLRLAMLPVYPIPLPFTPNDFSFLLAADTFAHGRLANPTPAMWTHLESIHITMQPTYMSMYFPGQGLLLAAGKVLLGNPWWGALIASALMCSAICWMLQAWLPPNWALLGGLIVVLRLGLFSTWTNTYHTAGSLAALGGALVLGALPRLLKTARFRYGVLMAIGISLLILTRPYEGLLLCLPVAVLLARWLMAGKNRPASAVLMRRAVVPLAIMIATVAWLGYYDLKAFGSPMKLPYTVDRATYAMAPYYIWQSQRPEPAYRHAAMRDFYHRNELAIFLQIRSLKGFLPGTITKVEYFFLFYAGYALLIPLLMARRVFLDRRLRFLVFCVLFFSAGMLLEVFLLPYYAAPFTGAFYAIGLQAMRHLRLWKPEGRPVGMALVRFIVAACVVLACLRPFAQPLHFAAPEWSSGSWNFAWFGPEHYGVERAGIESRLDQLPGGQLAIVRYASAHDTYNEWVYNAADVDGSKVVWAREMDATNNRELMRYYHDRKAWLVEPDETPARVLPYPPAEQGSGAAR